MPGLLSLMQDGGASVEPVQRRKSFVPIREIGVVVVVVVVWKSCRDNVMLGLSVSSACSKEKKLLLSLFRSLARSVTLWFIFHSILARAAWRFLMRLHIWRLALAYAGFYRLVLIGWTHKGLITSAKSPMPCDVVNLQVLGFQTWPTTDWEYDLWTR